MPTRKPKKPQAKPLVEVLADRVRYFRDIRGWTQDQLAEQVSRLGFNWTRVTVAEVEGKGRKRRVTIEELVALAMTFGTGVTHLLAPDAGETQIADNLSLSPAEMRAVMFLGRGDSGPPELRRMQLEFRREQARSYLERAEERQQEAQLNLAGATKDLEDIEEKLAEMEDGEASK